MHSKAGFRASCAMIVAAAGLLLMPAANAQNQTPSAPSRTAPADIPDHKLDAAAAAAKEVSAIGDSYQQKLAKAPAADKERIVGEADDAMKKAVTNKGLSIEEYKSIMQVAQSDPAVRNKLIQRLQ